MSMISGLWRPVFEVGLINQIRLEFFQMYPFALQKSEQLIVCHALFLILSCTKPNPFFVTNFKTWAIHLIWISSTGLSEFFTFLINVDNNLRASIMSDSMSVEIHLALCVRSHRWMMSNNRVEVASALWGVGNGNKSSRMLFICQLLTTQRKVAVNYPYYTREDHASAVRLTFPLILLSWSRIVILVDSHFSTIRLITVTRDGTFNVGLQIEMKFFNFFIVYCSEW